MLEALRFLFAETLLHDDALFTHVVTEHGPDHIMKVRSRGRSLMIASVHLEPGSSQRNLRASLQHNCHALVRLS